MIGIIGCQAMEQELRTLAQQYPPITHVKILPWDLHIAPDRLLQEVTRQIRTMQKYVSALCVRLVYARLYSLCGWHI